MFFNVVCNILAVFRFRQAVNCIADGLLPIAYSSKKSIISVALHLTDVASETDDLIAIAELVIIP